MDNSVAGAQGSQRPLAAQLRRREHIRVRFDEDQVWLGLGSGRVRFGLGQVRFGLGLGRVWFG